MTGQAPSVHAAPTPPPPELVEAVARASGVQRADLSPRLRVDPEARPAAILLLFGPAADGDGSAASSPEDLDVMLEVRADTLRTHAGEVAFPGGAQDPSDADAVAAALREAEEEIGLDPSDVVVLGALPELGTVSRFRVTPVVAWRTRAAEFRAVDPSETAAVMRVPLRRLLDPAHRFTAVYRGSGGTFRGPAFDVDGVVVWGFTAFVLAEFLDVAGWSTPWDRDRERDI